MNMATKTILGLTVMAVMTFLNASTVSAQCGYGGGYGGGGYGGGSIISIGFGGTGYGGGGYRGGGYGYGGGYGRNTSFYRSPVYHAPSVHLDRVYHLTRVHWTPSRGLHTHGHYDYVPHRVGGHFHY